jgi:hypothetical protein
MKSGNTSVKSAPKVTFHADNKSQKKIWDSTADKHKGTRRVLCNEMLRYVDSLNNVDSIFTVNDIPSIEEYWERREATAAVHCVTATLPYEDHHHFWMIYANY